MSDKKRTGISSITIENFKGIGAPVTITLKPITLLFGANSAGKSTILKSLAYLRETLSKWQHSTRVTISGQSVEIGTFKSAVYKHDETRLIKISITVLRPDRKSEHKDKKKRTWADSLEEMFPELSMESLIITMTVSSNGDARAEVCLNDEIVLWADGESIELNPDSKLVRKHFLEWDRRDDDDWFSSDELRNADLHYLMTLEDSIDFSKPWASYEFEIEPWSECESTKGSMAEAAARNAYDMCSLLFRALDNTIKEQRYIGPLRKIPARAQLFDEISPDDWYSGLAAWRELERIMRREPPYNGVYIDLTGFVEDAMPPRFVGTAEESLCEIRQLNLGYKPALKATLSVEYVNNGDPESTKEPPPEEELVQLLEDGHKPTRKRTLTLLSDDDVPVDPCDVGTGVSQALPIAVGAFADGGKFMMVEQPELHLHPRLQCDLADVFVTNIHRHVERKFMIETHSEHLILRLLRRIRETSAGKIEKDQLLALTPDDICVLYVKDTDEGTEVNEMEISDSGDLLTPWPNGFFPERISEILGE